MVEQRVQRRLAAILAADVVGFSRLMETDEAGTMAALKSRRRDVLDPLVAKHQGRIFKTTGDGVLVEFNSAVNAVQCAANLQQAMAGANDGQPEDRHIVLRIGVNLGDVMVEGDDLYGDGVNIAARLESLADPGGILVSGTAFDHIKSKIKVGFEDIGTQNLKNIAEPVRAYRVASTPTVAATALKSVTDKPSIAVLPFVNMSGDPEQKYFSDGITEDIITELSRFTTLSVIARHASFQFRDTSPDIVRISRQLGARYIVEGSVRRLGPRIRITAQLTDALTSRHLWAERYDRDLEELFAVQDEVVRAVVTSLVWRVEDAETLEGSRKPPQNWVAYDHVLRAREQMAFGNDWLPAEEHLRRATALEPTLSEAHALLIYILIEKYWMNGEHNLLDEALEHANMAITLNPNGSGPQFAMAYLCWQMGNYDAAGRYYDRALELNPNNIQARVSRAHWLSMCGKCEEALAALDAIPDSTPYSSDYRWSHRSKALFQLKRYQEVLEITGRWVKPDRPTWAFTVAALVHSGQMEQARQQLDALMKAHPNTTISRILRQSPYRLENMRDHLASGLRKAGMPE